MAWSGKLLGAFFGFLVAGPIGLLLGLYIGDAFDRGFKYRRQSRSHSYADRTIAENTFFKITFQVLGHIAKADGRVSEAEINATRSIMQQLNCTKKEKRQAIHYFNQGKRTEFDLNLALHQLLNQCRSYRRLLLMFIEFQTQMASIDGASKHKQAILHMIYQRLRIGPYTQRDYYHQEQQQSYSHYQYQRRSQSAPRTSLKDDYALLGIPSSASAKEIKRAYRKQMSQHHPDRLIAKKASKEKIQEATAKSQEIQAAHKRICEARGI